MKEQEEIENIYKLDDDLLLQDALDKIPSLKDSFSRINEKLDSYNSKQKFSDNNKIRIVKNIIGKEVIDNSANLIGIVKDLELNWDDQGIEAIIVSKAGILGSLRFSKSEKVIPYDMIKEIGDMILLQKRVKKNIY